MANDSIDLYKFYRRYLWRAEDFEGWQNGMVDHSRGMFEGLFQGAVLDGLTVSPSGSGLALTVSEGIASGPTGYLHVHNVTTDLTLSAPTGSNRVRHLVVSRPNLVDGDFITRPTNPFDSVPLTVSQEATVMVLSGTQASEPVYPTPDVNDVVICGVRLNSTQTTIARYDLDFEVRNVLGKSGNFQHNQAKYDDRCRVDREDSHTLRIKPSQTQVGIDPKTFLYIDKGSPSKFPLDGSSKFNYADTLVNLTTGQITGGDAFTPDFSPTIPSAGFSIVATVSLKSDHSLNVSYGTQGTRAECFDGIENARTSGAGSVALPSQMMRLAFCILRSADGANITEIDIFDARSTFYFGGPDNAKVYPNVFLSSAGIGDTTDLATALSLLPVNGGVLLVMDAVTGAAASYTVPANTRIIGRGKGSTLTFHGATGLRTARNVTLADLQIACTGACVMTSIEGPYNVMERVEFTAPSGASGAICVRVASDANHLGENVFHGVLAPSQATAIRYELGTSENTDQFNVFTT